MAQGRAQPKGTPEQVAMYGAGAFCPACGEPCTTHGQYDEAGGAAVRICKNDHVWADESARSLPAALPLPWPVRGETVESLGTRARSFTVGYERKISDGAYGGETASCFVTVELDALDGMDADDGSATVLQGKSNARALLLQARLAVYDTLRESGNKQVANAAAYENRYLSSKEMHERVEEYAQYRVEHDGEQERTLRAIREVAPAQAKRPARAPVLDAGGEIDQDDMPF